MRKMKCSATLLNCAMIVCIVLFSVWHVSGQDKGTFKDTRDGHVYKWVKSGTQVWMVTNLKFITPAGSWIYNNDSATWVSHGRLYDWPTAQKACPKGWRMPTDNDWAILIKNLGGEDEAGGKLQAMDTIVTPNGTHSSLLSGVRHYDGGYLGIGTWGACWSATVDGIDAASNYLFVHNGKGIGKSSSTKTTGFSVRCIRK